MNNSGGYCSGSIHRSKNAKGSSLDMREHVTKEKSEGQIVKGHPAAPGKSLPEHPASGLCLPEEWRLWVAENRLLGTPDDRLTDVLLQSGFDADLIQAELDRLGNDSYYLVAERMAQRFNKLKSVLDVRHSLSGLSYSAGSVERRSKISSDEFLERYYAANRPVILTGLLANTAARKRWTPAYLAQVCGDTTVQIMSGRQEDPRYEINSESHKREIKLAEYIEMVTQGGPSNDYYLVANNGFFDRPEVKALRDEVPQIPEYLNAADSKRKVFFWFGPAGTVTPLHHDLMNVLAAQITGRKRFTLIPPEQTAYLYNEIGVYSEVDCGQPDYSRHPLYRHVRPLTAVLGPGDVLFIPVGWWHYVKSLDVAIMVSYINFHYPNDFEWFHPHLR
jgi:hypothetical protein